MFRFWQGFAPVVASDGVDEHAAHSDSSDELIDLKGDKIEDASVVGNLNLTYLDLWALALTTSIGGHYLTWGSGLSAGFGTFIIATVIIASGFVCLLCCLAELSSALPFAGGAYGVARVTLGIYPGYLVACSDTFKSVVNVANVAINVGKMITIASSGKRHNEPIYWLVFYILAISLHAYGGRTQWLAIKGLTIISVLLLIIYLLGAAPFADLPTYAALDSGSNTPYEQWFHGGMYEFMHILARPCLFFTGIQNINLACREIRNPKTEVPKAYMAGLSTGLLTSFSTVLVACSLYPGVSVLKARIHPLTRGYMIMFGITRPQAMIISLPATIACGVGFMYFYGQKIRSMGQSRLLNPFLARELPGRHTPIVALVTGSVLGYALCIVQYFIPDVSIYLYNIGIMGAFATYLSIFLSFWRFRDCFPTITREFVSPLGKAGAAYGFAVFTLGLVSVCGFQKTQVAVSTFCGMIVVATAYYYLVVEKRQVFSEEEKTVMFKAYLVKGNASKNNRLRKGPGGAARNNNAGQGARVEMPKVSPDKGKHVRRSCLAGGDVPTESATTSVAAAAAIFEAPPTTPTAAAASADVGSGAQSPSAMLRLESVSDGGHYGATGHAHGHPHDPVALDLWSNEMNKDEPSLPV